MRERLGYLLKRCSNLKHVETAHGFMVRTALDHGNLLLSQFIETCSSLGLSAYAHSVFAVTPQHHRHTYVFNTMIKALTLCNSAFEALLVYKTMGKAELQPDCYSFPFALKAVVDLRALSLGTQIHSQTTRTGLDSNIHVVSALIQMYSSCACILDARKVFDDMQLNSVSPDDVVVWCAMITGYVKVGDPENAMDLLDRMPQTQTIGAGLVSWTSVISGYTQTDRPNKAIAVFRRMRLKNVEADEIAMLAVLSACAQLGAMHIQLGECIHGYIQKRGFDQMVPLKNALIEMYSKSGNISNALQVFDNMTQRTLISWTTIISALAFHGLGTQALDMFSRMEIAQIKPNDITFIAVLSACTHVGLLDLGRYYFDAMPYKYGIQPQIQHYGCMINLLGRAGYLAEAVELVSRMPFWPNAAIWGSILSASNIHGDAEVGELALLNLIELEPWNSGNYALLSNIYASSGRWDKSVMARKMMRDKGVRKMSGWSFVLVSNRAHEFVAGDTSHPQFEIIQGTLFNMNEHIKIAHCIPVIEFSGIQ
ncbi:Pentatricopeptide repeat-containing protein [Hibiscus syriacus]|uniref:Pentatricopeptide repeat-containing protein n=1 Tax=Hibiscus syriacus TaxID=106335 RepID=A0A6A2YD95_HIBSY|nr:pentatricopeptide repeat-containing protein At5g56310 [Hibiscus syriacus]KAE8673619.1 Pentatricopeptide repeat-containing protein [Hibiscus syriacus]